MLWIAVMAALSRTAKCRAWAQCQLKSAATASSCAAACGPAAAGELPRKVTPQRAQRRAGMPMSLRMTRTVP
jgi:hypothetical protein